MNTNYATLWSTSMRQNFAKLSRNVGAASYFLREKKKKKREKGMNSKEEKTVSREVVYRSRIKKNIYIYIARKVVAKRGIKKERR